MSPGYIPFHPNPSKPKYKPPAGAVDAHNHVFGPEAKFPFAPKRKYTPCDAPKEKLFALHEFLGFDKTVIVQATCHDTDNRALVDALATSNGKAKGVAFVGEEITDDELKELDRAGVKGVRFNFIKRLVDSTPKDVMQRIAKRIADLGWHIVIYFEHADLDEMGPFLKSLPTALVFDHMACPDREGGRRGQALPELAEGARRQQDAGSPRSPARSASPWPARPMTTWCRSPAPSWSVFPTACSGAPTGRTRTCRRRRPTTACWST